MLFPSDVTLLNDIHIHRIVDTDHKTQAVSTVDSNA